MLLCMLIKVLQPLYTKLIRRPAVLRDPNKLVSRQAILLVLGREVVLALKDDEGWDRLASCADINYTGNPLLVALLLSDKWQNPGAQSSTRIL